MEQTQKKLLILLASGPQDGGKRATLAFSAACSAQALGTDSQVFLVGDGSHWAYTGNADAVESAGFPPLNELMEMYLELDGEVFICAACDSVCTIPEGGNGRHSKIAPRGFAAVLGDIEGGASMSF